MRPRVKLEIKGLQEKVRDFLSERLEEEGALSEKELWEEALGYFSPELKKAASKLKTVYRQIYGRRIGKKTSELNVVENLRRILSEIKKELPHTNRQVVIGRKRFGRIFYASGKEGRIPAKVREIVEKNEGRAKEILKGVKRGPFRITPSYRRAAEMLEHYGIVELKKISGQLHAVEPGSIEADISVRESKRGFPDHFTVYRPFRVSVLVLRNGPEKMKLSFDVAAWDPIDRIFYLGMDREYVGTGEVETLIRNYLLLRIPAKLVIFCRSISQRAREIAGRWGVEIKEHN